MTGSEVGVAAADDHWCRRAWISNITHRKHISDVISAIILHYFLLFCIISAIILWIKLSLIPKKKSTGGQRKDEAWMIFHGWHHCFEFRTLPFFDSVGKRKHNKPVKTCVTSSLQNMCRNKSYMKPDKPDRPGKLLLTDMVVYMWKILQLTVEVFTFPCDQ